ncbi:MAG TPA: valine--pyruvate transaminase [Spirochaetia bacterium]|nr:valine--pyruvate transaminase [Spirochaetia bacterium]
MHYSLFGEKLSAHSGILELMQDLGEALDQPGKICMLGGGNPAHLPEVNALWRRRMTEILANADEFEHMVADYDSPKGKHSFLTAVASLLEQEYGWDIGPENVAVTNGSQSAFFYLFNMFAGGYPDGRSRQILCPVIPEYVGYADQGVHSGMFRGTIPFIEELPPHRFKYRVNFDRVAIDDQIGAICVSRPTNPTGNVVTDEEIARLSAVARERGIPLLVDNAYGMPFPGIIFTDASPVWEPGIVLSMSLSKLGLPSVRTGIIVADPDIVSRLAGVNAVVSLANGSLGQVLTRPMFEDGSILSLARDVIRPFYRARAALAQQWVDEFFGDNFDYAVHVCEGSIFLWIWFRNLTISTKELYRRLKARGVIVVPGEYFFFGIDDEWPHSRQCIRVNYCHNSEAVREGISIIGEEVHRASR